MIPAIGFYGAGNMAQAMIAGLLKTGFCRPEELYVYNHRYEPTLLRIEKNYGIQPVLDEKILFEKAAIIIFAVKPDILKQILPTIKPLIKKHQLLVSVAAGVSLTKIAQLIGRHKVVRAMPNTPAVVGEAMTSLSPNDEVTDSEIQRIRTIFSSFGKAKVIAEQKIDAVVGVAGSSPAYVYMFIEALADGAVAEGMSRTEAYEFAAQAVLGAVKMVQLTGLHPGELKDQVSSPNGTTIAAVQSLEENKFRASVIRAVESAAQRNRQLEE